LENRAKVKSSHIYLLIYLFTIQIVSKQPHNDNMKKKNTTQSDQ